MSEIYLLAGIAAIVLYGRTWVRRFWRRQRIRDRRSWRELMEATGFLFVAWSIFGLTLGGLIGLPRAWLVVGAAAAVGAFVVAGWVFDREDRDDRP